MILQLKCLSIVLRLKDILAYVYCISYLYMHYTEVPEDSAFKLCRYYEMNSNPSLVIACEWFNFSAAVLQKY